MPHRHRVADVCSYDSSSSDEFYTTIHRPRHVRHSSVVSSHHHHHLHEPVYAPSPNLAVPVVDVGGSRKRASSTTGLPQPNIIINADGRSRSHSRERPRRRSPSRGRRFDDDEYEEFIERRGRISRTPSPYYRPERVERVDRVDYETRKALEKLKIFEQEKAAEEAQRKYKAETDLKRAKEQLEKAEAEEKQKALEKKAIEEWQREYDAKKAKEKKEKAEAEERQKALEKKAIEDWQREQEAKKAKEKKAKEEEDKRIEERLRQELVDRGYTSAQIEAFLKKDKDALKRVEHEKRIAHMRPTFIKVHKKYLLPETLDIYQLPWSYDPKDSDYILIERYVDDDLQDELFAHTKRIKSRKLIEPAIEKKVIVKINDRKKDKMYLVRKKDTSPMRFGILG